MDDQTRTEHTSPEMAKLQTANPFGADAAGQRDDMASSPTDRRNSTDEWDASKVPPSRFQKRKGSIYATPGSRDGHVDRNYAVNFHDKHTEKGYGKSGKPA